MPCGCSTHAHDVVSSFTQTGSSTPTVTVSNTGGLGLKVTTTGTTDTVFFQGEGTSVLWANNTKSAATGYGVAGSATSNGVGIYGSAGVGVQGDGTNVGVKGISVYGVGVAGTSTYSAAVYGISLGSGNAGSFIGNVNIAGTLSKSAGSFVIDHPLDPENMILTHSFVESPDMKNVYDGVGFTDATGELEVELPSYFEALNKDFRYQLTAVDCAAPDLHVSQKVKNNKFKVSGGKPNMEVCWQVTGSRKDAYAVANPIVVEKNKDDKKGRFLNPEVFGKNKEDGFFVESSKEDKK